MRFVMRPRPTMLHGAMIAAGGLALTLAVPAVQANPPAAGWRVGEPMEVSVDVSPAELQAARADGIGVLTAAGVSGTTYQTSRAFNKYDNATQDTTVALNAQGRAVGTLTRDVDRGLLRSLVRFDDLGAARGGVVGAMPDAARGILQAIGVNSPPTAPELTWDDGMEAWSVQWKRFVDGVPVPADGLTVWVTPTGQLRAVANKLTDVVRGATVINESRARESARRFMDGNSIARGASFTSATLEWRQSNDFIDPSGPDSPSPTLRLVYAIAYHIVLDNGLDSRGVLWVDAETGDLVGGSDIG